MLRAPSCPAPRLAAPPPSLVGVGEAGATDIGPTKPVWCQIGGTRHLCQQLDIQLHELVVEDPAPLHQ